MKQVDMSSADAAAVKCDLAGEVLRLFGKLHFAATGWSMLPSIWPGETLVVERDRSRDQIHIGELCWSGATAGSALIASSGAGDSRNPQWITQGDAMPVPDRPVNWE